jgi:hypothetical protein
MSPLLKREREDDELAANKDARSSTTDHKLDASDDDAKLDAPAAPLGAKADGDAVPSVQPTARRAQTSRFRGVSLKSGRRHNPWKAVITVHNQTKHLGYFATEALAVRAPRARGAERLRSRSSATAVGGPARRGGSRGGKRLRAFAW